MNILKIFILTLIKQISAYECEEYKKSINYKGSCCTINDFIANTSDYFINGINSTKITRVSFVNYQSQNIPKVFQMNPGIIELNITNGKLKNIQEYAFKNAGGLNFLILTKNQLEKLDEGSFYGAQYLYKLDLTHNLISLINETAFIGLEFLSYLYLDDNKIERLESKVFQPLKRLFKLTLSNNQIKSIDPKIVYFCNKLDYFDISRNLLSGKVSLVNKYNEICLINIAENQIKSLEVIAETCISTRKLQLTIIARNNELNNVTISNNYNLTYLNLFDNQIESMNFIVKAHCNISYMNIGKNPLKTQEAPDWFNQMKHLKYLNMSLINFNNLSNNIFVGMPELQILDLSNVILDQPLELKTLKNLQNLEMLDMSNVYINGVSASDIKYAIKNILPNLRCWKYNQTNGWICQAPYENYANENPPMRIDELNIEINSNKSIPLWMKVSFVTSIVILILVCMLSAWIKRQKQHQIINNINVGSTTTDIEML